jgi:uncharacterized LabA/DUF88 family protein
MKRVYCYIDGFNLYHSIVEIAKKKYPPANHLKWLDLKKLAEKFLKNDENLEKTFYFSAYAKHIFNAYKRHEKYVAALEAVGIETVLGKFKKKYPRCAKCRQTYLTHEEKESDINLALYILQHAFENRYDTLFLVTADSDLLAVIYRLKTLFPKLEIVLLIPPGRGKLAAALKKEAHRWYEIKPSHLKGALLPPRVVGENGHMVIRPSEYDPPDPKEGGDL